MNSLEQFESITQELLIFLYYRVNTFVSTEVDLAYSQLFDSFYTLTN